MKKLFITTTAFFYLTSLAQADVQIYGQVNKGVAQNFDGVHSRTHVFDNAKSVSRFGLKYSADLERGFTATSLIELGNSGPSFSSGQLFNAIDSSMVKNNKKFYIRHARVGLGNQYGVLFLGKTGSAADDTMGADLAGTKDVADYSFFDIAPNNKINGVYFFDHDGIRENVIRFDTAIYKGLQAKLSAQTNDKYQLGLFYNDTFEKAKVSAAFGYQIGRAFAPTGVGSKTEEDVLTGSASARLEDFAIAIAYGNAKNSKIKKVYSKLTYFVNNKNEVSFDFGSYDDKLNNAKTNYMGFAYQKELNKSVSAAGYYKWFNNMGDAEKENSNIVGVNLKVKL